MAVVNMEVALIDGDRKFHSSMRKKIEEFNSSDRNEKILVDYFSDSIDFGKSNLNKYNVIITNVKLRTIQGLFLIDSIRNKTNCYFALLIDRKCIDDEINENYTQNVLNDDRINEMFDRGDHIRHIITWLRFMQSRISIKNRNLSIESGYNRCMISINNLKK